MDFNFGQFVGRLHHPIWWGLFIVSVVFFTSTFNLTLDGIMYAVVISAVLVATTPTIGSMAKKQFVRALEGHATNVDFMMAPSGYRRARLDESPEEAAAQTVVRPTPNMPLYEADEDENVVEALPSQSVVRAAPTSVATKRQFMDPVAVLSEDCQPPLDMLLGRGILGVGQRGTGKSNLAARLIEEVGRFPIPMCIFDYKEDYITLPSVLTERCLIAGAPNWNNPLKGDHYWSLTPENAEQAGMTILENGVQLVFQVISYEQMSEAVEVMVGILKGMTKWATAQRPGMRVPALILLDEAQQFLPQNFGDAKIKISPEQASLIFNAFEKLNSIGRSLGLTPAFFTQRIAQLRKEVIGGAEIFFLMRQTQPADLKVYDELLGKDEKGKLLVDHRIIQALGTGEGIVYESGEYFITQFFQRRSEHLSVTPDLGAAVTRYSKKRFTKSLLASDVNTSPLQGDASFKDLYAELTGEALEDEPQQSDEDMLIERGINAYLEGHKSQAQLSAVLGISAWEARNLQPKIVVRVKQLEEQEDA